MGSRHLSQLHLPVVVVWLLQRLCLTREETGDLTAAAMATDYEVTSRAVPGT